jgi:hypothetical protein
VLLIERDQAASSSTTRSSKQPHRTDTITTMASSTGLDALAAATTGSSKDFGSEDSPGSISGTDSPPPRGAGGASAASSGALSAASSAAGGFGGGGGGDDPHAEDKRKKKLELNRIASRVRVFGVDGLGFVGWGFGRLD